MHGEKTHKNPPQKLALALVVLSLSLGGGMTLAHKAYSQETGNTTDQSNVTVTPAGTPVDEQGMKAEYGPDWRNVLQAHDKKVTDWKDEREKLLQNAKDVVFSDEKGMDELQASYPFLQKDFQKIKDMQQKEMEYMNEYPDKAATQSPDVSPHIHVAEVRDPKSGINVFFVGKSGPVYCSQHGCPVDVYVDTGTGYKMANEFMVPGDLKLSIVDGQAALFFPGKGPIEWDLKGGTFVKNNNKPPED